MDSPSTQSPVSASSMPTCPPAPKKATVEKQRRLDDIPKLELPDLAEQEELEMIYVRWKYQLYNQEDVKTETDINLLHDMRRWYSPSSQTRNEVEWNYIYGVLFAAEERLRQLKCNCSGNENLWDNMTSEELLSYF